MKSGRKSCHHRASLLAVFALLGFSRTLRAEEIVRVVSHEDPGLNVATSHLGVGSDGRVYLSSGQYVLRVERDGSRPVGSPVRPATWAATANADGIVATASGHFQHSVFLWDPQFQPLGAVDDFLVSDRVEWWAPCDVEVGSSGDFFGIDPNRNRILRIKPSGTVALAYSLAASGENFAATTPQFRVWERGRRFYVMSSGGTLRAIGFDGRVLWSIATEVRKRPEIWAGGFDVDDVGRTSIIGGGDVVKEYDVQGRLDSKVRLAVADPALRISDIRIFGDELIVKSISGREIFEVYDRRSGALRRIVAADVDEVIVTLPPGPWIAGARLPVGIQLSRHGASAPQPIWRAWLRPIGTPVFHELELKDGWLKLPADAAGLVQLRLSPSVEGASDQYTVDKIAEVHAPLSRGGLSVATPLNRIYFGQGEAIPIRVRSTSPSDGEPKGITLQVRDDVRVVAQAGLELHSGSADVSLAPELTRALRPGHYRVTSDVPGTTVAAQEIDIGPGIADAPAFSVVQHGDYEAGFPAGTSTDTPEKVAAHIERARRLGVNMFVDRLGVAAVGIMDLVDATVTVEPALPAQRKSGVFSALFDKALQEGPVRRTLAAYGAFGIEERGILLANDAGLPLGTGFDGRTPEQMTSAIEHVTRSLAAYPAFRGWSWAANWWVEQRGADAALSAAERAGYEAALKKLTATGAWSPIIDSVWKRTAQLPVDAEHRFNAALQRIAPGALSAMTGPYRGFGVDPAVAFRNANEVDLHYQAEQIQPLNVTPHEVDFYKRPGKRAWGHPELWNDDGTGAMIMPTLFEMIMRGADGVGWSGPPPWAAPDRGDPRATGSGQLSMLRAVGGLLRDYGRWLTTLRPDDRVAIVVSSRMLAIDAGGRSVMNEYFGHLYEAYNACLYAHRPASFVFAEEAQPSALLSFRAVLVVGQRVELDPSLATALERARAVGVRVFYDQTSRPELLTSFTAIDVAFDHTAADPSLQNDDSSYPRLSEIFKEDAAIVDRELDFVPPAARTTEPDVAVTRRKSGEGRFVWVVDNVLPDVDPAVAWRTGLFVSQRVPLDVSVGLDAAGASVYDVFGLRRVFPINGVVEADLRSLPARLYAILPRPIASVELGAPAQVVSGQELAWTASVSDDLGRPVSATMPVHVELIDSKGEALREAMVATGVGVPAGDRWIVPLNIDGSTAILRATELISGRSAEVRVEVSAAPRLPDLGGEALHPTETFVRKAISRGLGLSTPAERRFGAHLKDLAIGGDVAVTNAMNRDENVYGIDLSNGSLRFRRTLGDHDAYGPRRIAGGFAVQGFDQHAAEGYELYVLDESGAPRRRFALYGLPKRATRWSRASDLTDPIDQFAASPSGDWVASAGDLGLVMWASDGRRLWSVDWWRTARRRMLLLAQNRETLLALEGCTATAYEATTGATRWTIRLADAGRLLGAEVDATGNWVAIRSDVLGGRVFLLRGGRVVATISSSATAVQFAPDARFVAITTGSELRWYSAAGTLLWTYAGDSALSHPRVAPDGDRVVVGSELGTLTVLSAQGEILSKNDLQALPVADWLPDGDLVVATWMGDVLRLTSRYEERWRTHVSSAAGDIRQRSLFIDRTPVTRVETWGNAAGSTAALVPNVLSGAKALVLFKLGSQRTESARPINGLTDGKPDVPADPWLPWTTMNLVDSGWSGSFSVELDAFRTQVHATGITLIEDPSHPESWLRDVRLQYWDARAERWRDGPFLLSNSASHTHWFPHPIDAARFRLESTGGGTWPPGNLRMGEIVLHGTLLGPSHPDVVEQRAVAVLFDEDESDVAVLRGRTPVFGVSYRDAFSGGKCLELRAEGEAGPAWEPPFGHAVPNWDFEIAENPRPGQFRWLQFAWKALSPKTTGLSLLIGRPFPTGGYLFVAGDHVWREGYAAVDKVAGQPPTEWSVVRVDLWRLSQTSHVPALRVQSLGIQAVGGGAAFDQIVLARTRADLDRLPRIFP
ncbi:MAG: hypothetical protein ABSC94_26005 [Polyangiaceae bacterium]|jgi:hypothetical protein